MLGGQSGRPSWERNRKRENRTFPEENTLTFKKDRKKKEINAAGRRGCLKRIEKSSS